MRADELAEHALLLVQAGVQCQWVGRPLACLQMGRLLGHWALPAQAHMDMVGEQVGPFRLPEQWVGSPQPQRPVLKHLPPQVWVPQSLAAAQAHTPRTQRAPSRLAAHSESTLQALQVPVAVSHTGMDPGQSALVLHATHLFSPPTFRQYPAEAEEQSASPAQAWQVPETHRGKPPPRAAHSLSVVHPFRHCL